MVRKEKEMTPEEISQSHTALTQLGERLDEIREAAIRKPWSRDIAFLEKQLSTRFNTLIEELNQAGVKHDYKTRPIVEDEKPVPLTWLQQMFVETGMTPADLTKDDVPPRSASGDGMKDLIGY